MDYISNSEFFQLISIIVVFILYVNFPVGSIMALLLRWLLAYKAHYFGLFGRACSLEKFIKSICQTVLCIKYPLHSVKD